MKRIILHIGSEKTASSSLQRFLSKVSTLPGCPFDYLQGENDEHSFLLFDAFRELARQHGDAKDYFFHGKCNGHHQAKKMLERLDCSTSTTIISCELFYRSPASLKALLIYFSNRNYEVDILVFLRSFPGYCRSLYLESLKWGEKSDPLHWLQNQCSELLSTTSLAICQSFYPGRITLANYDHLCASSCADDIYSYTLGFLDSKLGSNLRLCPDILEISASCTRVNQALSSSLSEVLRSLNRCLDNVDLARAVMSFILHQSNASPSAYASVAKESPKLEQELLSMHMHAEALSNRFMHHLAFNGLEDIEMRI